MKKLLSVLGIVTALGVGLAAPAFAGPSGHTGPPNQDCADFSASTRPGQTASSPGAPFNEAGINSANGGVGGRTQRKLAVRGVLPVERTTHKRNTTNSRRVVFLLTTGGARRGLS
jgi:hypothetical protein